MEWATAMPRGGTDEAIQDDATLVRAARGKPAAFGALYERYRDRVYWYLLARTGSEEDAADLTQEVFFQALDALPRYDASKAAFPAWLIGIAHHLAVNWHRRARRHVSVAWDLALQAVDRGRAFDLEADVVHREALEHLRGLLAALDPAKQELLALRFVAGLTAAEIAAVIGKSEAATKKQLERTLQSLKGQYRDVAR